MLNLHRKTTVWALALLGLAGLALLTSCNVASTGGGGTGRLNVLATDSPSDDWAQFTVTLTSIKLRNMLTKEWTDNLLVIDPNDPTSGQLDLITLSGVATLLSHSTIPTGTYDRLKITINTDPATMTLVEDGQTTPIPAANIIVAGGGDIKVDLAPAITVDANGVANVQVDFDLAHPMAIILQNGKVVVNLVLRHKAIPRNLFDVQFARTLGTWVSTDTTAKTMVVTPVSGADVTFGYDDATTFINVETHVSGHDPSVLTAGIGVLVASNLKNDGTLYANVVWYGPLEKLPQSTPEGIVRRIGDNWIKVYNKNATQTSYHHYDCHWDYDLIYVNSATEWMFQGTKIGQGTSFLHNIRRGFRVLVTLDTTVSSRVAKTIDIQSAHDEGVIRSVTATGFTFSGDDYGRCWYDEHWRSNEWAYSTVPDHRFVWWFYGEALPAAPTDDAGLATVIQNFVDTVTQAKSANLRAFARVELTWDAALNKWVAENVILAPEKLPDPAHITVGFTTASGSIVVGTFDWDNPTMPTVMTVNLDSTSNLQTIVGSLLWNSTTRILTLKVPVDPLDWESYLTPALLGVRIWVRPVKNPTDGTFSWTAYAVLGFQVITN